MLSSERPTYAAQNLEAVAALSRLTDAVGLFTAIGAGWQGMPLTATTLPIDEATQRGLARAAEARARRE